MIRCCTGCLTSRLAGALRKAGSPLRLTLAFCFKVEEEDASESKATIEEVQEAKAAISKGFLEKAGGGGPFLFFFFFPVKRKATTRTTETWDGAFARRRTSLCTGLRALQKERWIPKPTRRGFTFSTHIRTTPVKCLCSAQRCAYQAHAEHKMNEDLNAGMNRGAADNNGVERPPWYTKEWPKDGHRQIAAWCGMRHAAWWVDKAKRKADKYDSQDLLSVAGFVVFSQLNLEGTDRSHVALDRRHVSPWKAPSAGLGLRGPRSPRSPRASRSTI